MRFKGLSSMADNPVALVLGGLWVILNLVANWKLFKKAGKAGIAAIIPIYNIFVLMKILNGKAWTALLYLVPPVAVVYSIINTFRMAVCYGKGIGTGIIGLIFNPIMRLYLAFSDDVKYTGSKTITETFQRVDNEV